MFGVEDLKRTTFAQEMRLEGELEGKLKVKIKTVPRLLAKGFSIQEVAEILELEISQVRSVINSSNPIN